MRVTIDRFEGEFAVCERPDRTMLNIRRDRLPAGAAEGDVLLIEGDAIRVDARATGAKRRAADGLLKDLWK